MTVWAKKYLSLFVTLFLFTHCAQENALDLLEIPSELDVIETSDYPAVVRVIGPGGVGLCTGTFISSRAVLTAAHCTLDAGTYTVLTSFGTYATNTRENYGTGDVDDPNDLSVLVFSGDVADSNTEQVLPIGDSVGPLNYVRIVGFGCTNIDSGLGVGIKRTGTNQVYRLTDYIELATPITDSNTVGRGILGPLNRAGSCFGDSGGPLLRERNERWEIVGVGHAGGISGDYIISQYGNVNRGDNLNFLSDTNALYGLDMVEACQGTDSLFCQWQSASMQIVAFLTMLWKLITGLFF